MSHRPSDAAAAPARGRLFLVVAHLAPKKRGSLEDQFAALARAVVRRGDRMHLVLARAPAPSVASLWTAAGATWEVIDFGRPARAAWQLAAIARRLVPSLIHLHFVRASSPIAAVARLSGAAVVMNDHLALEAPAATGNARARRWLTHAAHRSLRGALDLAGGVTRRGPWRRVPVSEYVAATVMSAEGVPARRIRVIENGIDVERYARPAHAARSRATDGGHPPARAIACVARMAAEKGVDVAIRALALLRGASTIGAAPSLLVVGDGPDAPACAELARALGVGDAVKFLGLRDDVETVLATCVQAWVPSRAPEAFGLAAAEAMAAGLPVVATRVGGLPEVVAHELTGVLVPPGDPFALARAAGRLLDDEARARAMGDAGRSRAREEFSLERFVARVLRLYDELAPSRDRHRAPREDDHPAAPHCWPTYPLFLDGNGSRNRLPAQ